VADREPGVPAPGKAAPGEFEAFLAELERTRLRALVARDLEVAASLHAPGYQLVNPGGAALSREAYLGGIASGDLDYRVFEPASDIAVVRLGDGGAAVRYQARIDIRFGAGERDGGLFWHTDLYLLRDGRWQAIWSQATRIRS
jgi:hypothetical protein